MLVFLIVNEVIIKINRHKNDIPVSPRQSSDFLVIDKALAHAIFLIFPIGSTQRT
jgi:hypothetical protein